MTQKPRREKLILASLNIIEVRERIQGLEDKGEGYIILSS